MSALSRAQFAGTEAIANSQHSSRGPGWFGGLLELGLDDKNKVRLQPAGTNQFKLYEAFQTRKDKPEPVEGPNRQRVKTALKGASTAAPVRGVRRPRVAGAR